MNKNIATVALALKDSKASVDVCFAVWFALNSTKPVDQYAFMLACGFIPAWKRP